MTKQRIEHSDPDRSGSAVSTAGLLKSPFNRVLAAATLIFAALALTGLFLPAGQTLPTPLLMLQMVAIILMFAMHMIRHLGIKLTIALIVMGAVVEMISEIINAANGAVYGPFFYSDGLGPKFLGVPVSVPPMFAVLLWPAFAVVNVLLNRRMSVAGLDQGIPRLICFCLIGGFFSSSIWFTTEPLCINMGFFEYTGVTETESYFGADLHAVHGWGAVVAIQLFIFIKLLVPTIGAPEEKPLHPILDSVPFLYMGVLALMFYINPVNPTTGTVTMWSMGAFTLAGAFCLGPAIKASRERLVVADPD